VSAIFDPRLIGANAVATDDNGEVEQGIILGIAAEAGGHYGHAPTFSMIILRTNGDEKGKVVRWPFPMNKEWTLTLPGFGEAAKP
jgi:hypothetical protein